MTENDRAAVQDFLAKLRTARLPEKSPELERMVEETFQVQPDAAQLLVIKCMLQQHALDELRAEIESLRNQLAQRPAPAQTGGSDRGWFARLTGQAPRQPQPPPASQPAYAPQPAAAPAYGPFGGGSLLGSIATTAAGVAAGEFLFDGIEHMLHGSRGYGFGGAAAFGEVPVVENITVNEYGAQPQARGDSFIDDNDVGARDADFDDAGYTDDSFSDDDSMI